MDNTSMPDDYIELLLRKVKAVILSNAGSRTELAKFIFKTENPTEADMMQVYRWLSGARSPNGGTTAAMQAWVGAKTLEIDAAGSKMKAAYRKAFGK